MEGLEIVGYGWKGWKLLEEVGGLEIVGSGWKGWKLLEEVGGVKICRTTSNM